MKILLTVAALIIAFSYLHAQIESTGVPDEKQYLPVFNYDIVNFPEPDTSASRIDIFVQVPFSTIRFTKAPTGKFKSEYSITVSIFDQNKEKLLNEKSWLEKVEVDDFEQTLSSFNYHLSYRGFLLNPDRYYFRIIVEDKDSRKEFKAENLVTVRDFTNSIMLSDVIIVEAKHWSPESNTIYPNVSRSVLSAKDGVPLYFEIVSSKDGEIQINYSITSVEKKTTAYTSSEVIGVTKGENKLFKKIDGIDLGLGDYMLTVQIVDEKSEYSVSTQKRFIARLPGVPFIIKDINKAIDQMLYIASSSELDSIRKAGSDEEKLKRFFDYWKSKDRNPATSENEVFNEYYRRVEYANKNFTHYVEGWRTDMGMVYIILGTPSNVDRHPFELNSKPYEIWHYYELNRQFVFMDYTGFGDYRLITPFYGDVNRFK